VFIRSADADSSLHLDFVPMVDVLFNLLIFFLLATSLRQAEREMEIALPITAAVGPVTQAMKEIVVNVNADGHIIVAGRRIEAEELADMIKTSVANNPQQKVSVRGDRTTAYANIVRVLDICKGAGLQEPYLDTIHGN
jgi:biopolymer transport protein ExbD